MNFRKPWWRRVVDRIRRKGFHAEPVRFCATLPRESDILIVLPQSPFWTAVALRTLISILDYFQGEKWIWGTEILSEWFEIYDLQATYVEDPRSLESVDILFDFSPPPSPYRELPEHVPAQYRVSFDPASYPYYNLIVSVDFSQVEPYLALCRIFSIDLKEIEPEPPHEMRRRVWDHLVYKGHTREKRLIFLDTPITDEEASRIESAIVRATYVSTHGDRGIDISRMDPLEQLAVLSLSDLYIGDESFFLPMAMMMGIPCLIKRPPAIHTDTPIALWTPGEDLHQVLEGLLSG